MSGQPSRPLALWNHGDTDKERCTLPDFAIKPDLALMLVHDNVETDGQALPGTFSYWFGGEEWVKDSIANAVGDTDSIVTDLDLYVVVHDESAQP
jgi:hypothetical protein